MRNFESFRLYSAAESMRVYIPKNEESFAIYVRKKLPAGLVWMQSDLHLSTCFEVDWSKFHLNTYELK